MASNYYSDGRISIPNVTGNITITITAVAQGPSYTNQADYGGSDWKFGARIRSGGAIDTATNSQVSNGILVAPGDIIRIQHGTTDTTGYNNWMQNAISAVFTDLTATTGTVFARTNVYDSVNDIVTFTVPSGASGYMRLMFFDNAITSNIIITVNEAII